MWITSARDTTKLTLELRELVENGVKLWDFDYPSFYQGEEKKAFEQKVIDHYYFRQIGQETVGRFLHCFRSKVREIMPYYIDLYKSDKLFKEIDDPFKSYDLTEEFEQDSEGTSQGNGSTTQAGTSNSLHKFANTPQGTISNLDTHLTEASQDENDSDSTATSENESTSTGKVTHRLHRFGNIGVQPLGDEIEKLRKAYINIDMMIINELNDCFLKIY